MVGFFSFEFSQVGIRRRQEALQSLSVKGLHFLIGTNPWKPSNSDVIVNLTLCWGTKMPCGSPCEQLAHLAEMEVKHRCRQVLEMGFIAFGLAKLFAQDWEGDVTIVMPATFAQVSLQ